MILLISFASASFVVGNTSSITDRYAPGTSIKGWINISFQNENLNSIFSVDSKNVSLSDLLNHSLNSNYDYSCTPLDCTSDYTPSNSQTTKTIDLQKGQTAFVGISLNKNIKSIDTMSFVVQSDAVSSCSNQFYIDVLADGIIELKNNQTSSEFCSSSNNYGCFDMGRVESTSEYLIKENYICQKYNISESPGIRFGIWIRNLSSSETLTVGLSKADNFGEELATCNLPSASSSGGEVFCDINYTIENKNEYYVCVYSNNGLGKCSVRGYSLNNTGCAFSGTEVPSKHEGAYQMFIKEKKFGKPVTMQFSEDVSSDVEEYLIKKYETLDCLGKECVIPIKITARENQIITIKNLVFSYQETLGDTTESKLYDLSEIPTKINSEYQQFYLDNGNFSVSKSLGNYTLNLLLNDKKVFTKKVLIEAFPTINRISPVKTASAYPTTFSVETNSSISSYEWNFGDNATQESTTKSIKHTYALPGNYSLNVKITDFNGRSTSKTVSVLVDSPITITKTILAEDKKNLESIKNMTGIDDFSKETILSLLNLTEAELKLNELEIKFNNSNSTEEYNEILTALLGINIPEKIIITASSPSIGFYPQAEFVNFDVQPILGENYSQERYTDYSDALFFWSQENVETKVSIKEWSAVYESQETPLIKIFEVSVTGKKTFESTPYLIIKKLYNIKFAGSYGQKEDGDYYYIELKDRKNVIAFSTTEEIDFATLPVFVSPNTDGLNVEQLGTGEDNTAKKWIIFGLIIIGLFGVGFAVYWIMQRWYQKRYEDSLFKNKNNLYNIMTYITNSKKQGITEENIIMNLKKAKWSGEQIKYAMRKYYGKKIPGIINSEDKSQKK